MLKYTNNAINGAIKKLPHPKERKPGILRKRLLSEVEAQTKTYDAPVGTPAMLAVLATLVDKTEREPAVDIDTTAYFPCETIDIGIVGEEVVTETAVEIKAFACEDLRGVIAQAGEETHVEHFTEVRHAGVDTETENIPVET